MTSQPRRILSRRAPVARRTGAATGAIRLRWLLGVYFLLMVLVGYQLVQIQLVDRNGYAQVSAAQRARTIELAGDRGRIYDRDGDVLATTVEAATIYADPRAFRPGETPDGLPVPPASDAAEVAAQLADLLGRPAADLEQRLRSDSHFVYLARQLDHEIGEQVRALRINGVGVIGEPRRVYPAGGLAAQIVGFAGIDGQGLQGLEARYDELLLGRPGLLRLERAPGGLDIASGTRELVPSEPGTDLVLTIDRDVQAIAERAAADVVAEFNALGASIIVLEVGTGDVLAMASYPSYDPNERGASDPDAWRNRAVTDVFEPGSVQKAFTIAGAIEDGLVDEHSVWSVPESLTIGGRRWTDAVPQPTAERSLAEVMERSSNVGTIQLAEELGAERLEAYLRAFGEGRALGSAFPGQAAGLLMSARDWWQTSLPTIAIGQGVAVTLLQMANGYATLANDGVEVLPRIVRGTVGEDGRLSPAPAPAQRRVVSEDTARQVQRMLELVVTGDHGTGALASVDGYRVAGKTGTARKPSTDERGYSGEYVASFVGFAPAEHPQLVVAVMVDEPDEIYGGVVAAPVFAEVMEMALASRRVRPDDTGIALTEVLARAAAERADAERADAERANAEDADLRATASGPTG